MSKDALIRTKLKPPHLGEDLIPRPHLINRLNSGLDYKFTLISAQAGAGKSTLLAQWLGGRPQAIAWLSLDKYDDDLMSFVSYLCAAIQMVLPSACEEALSLLNTPQTPPLRIVTASLINELDDLFGHDKHSEKDGRMRSGLIIAIDDYHNITEPAVHELLSYLIAYLPQGVHLVVTSRTDPPLPLARLRARKEMFELRTNDLRFTKEEAGVMLELTSRRELDSKTVALLKEKTEGWGVGLRLAALSIRDLPDAESFVHRFQGTSSSSIVDYLVSEVLSQQSPTHQEFLLHTSILDRFKSELCDYVLWRGDKTDPAFIPSQSILQELNAANLFLIPLDQGGIWFRYHHLFRDLLQLRLKNQYTFEEVAALHTRAGQWFKQKGFFVDAINHALLGGNIELVVQVIAEQRYALMNEAKWQKLERYLRHFPAEIIEQYPDLLILKAWLLYHHSHYGQLAAHLQQMEETMSETTMSPESVRHLKGEMSALRSLLAYYKTEVNQTIVEANFSIKNTPPELWIVRILARLLLAGALQMRGDLNQAYDAIYRGADEEIVQSNSLRATMLVSVSDIHWVEADLQGLMQVANQCLELFNYSHSVEIRGYAHYHLGCAHYHRNELIAAEKHFSIVVQKPHLNYGECFVHSAFGLAMVYQALSRPDDALETVSSAVAYLLETGNMTLLPVTRAFQAELGLRQGRLAAAQQWAAQFETISHLSPMVRLFRSHFTLVKTWIACATDSSRLQAAELLDQLKEYAEATHNTSVLIEVLALQAVVLAEGNDEPTALTMLEKAITIAQPGGFVRLFVDLGKTVARLLHMLNQQGIAPDYTDQILAAFTQMAGNQELAMGNNDQHSSPESVEPLTPREQEVLELLAKRLTNKEIAKELVVSPGTVKTHTINIYAKLNVTGRWQAVDKGTKLGLISLI